MLTPRALFLLLLIVPLAATAAWVPSFEWLAVLHVLACLALFWTDWRLAQGAQRFELRRRHDNRLSLGEQNAVRLELHNRAALPAVFQLRDEAPEAFMIETRILIGAADPHGAWNAQYHVRPLRRGDYRFGDLHLRWQGPLKLVVRQARYPSAAPVKVYPNLLDIRRYDLLLKQNRLQEIGLRHTRLFGQGTEYERLREYQPDDDFRRIDWKATARRRHPVTVEYQTERSQNIILMLDTGRMMQSPVAEIAKLDYVLNAALLLAYVAAGKGDKVGLLAFSDRPGIYFPPRQGRGQFYRLLEQLYRVDAQPVEPDYRRAFATLALKNRRRSLVVLFTDLTGSLGMEELVKHAALLGRVSLPLVVTISDPDVIAAAERVPVDSLEAYRRAAAENLLEDRALALEQLHLHGVPTLDVPANRLSLSVINRYLEIKGRMRL